MMAKPNGRATAAMALIAVLAIGLAAFGQETAASGSVRLLVIDETKTFLSTMRVGGLVGALRGIGLLEVGVKLADVESSWTNPLDGATPDPASEPYDLMLVIPLGIDDGSADWVWIISDGLTFVPPTVAAGIEAIRQVVGLVFEGGVRSVGVFDDLMPSYLYWQYRMEGWMR